MNSWQVSWRNLMRKKWRSFLTLLAIILGVAATVSSIAMVQSTQSIISDYASQGQGNTDYYVFGQQDGIDTDYIDELAEENVIEEVLGQSNQRMTLDKEVWDQESEQLDVQVMAIDHLENAIYDITVLEGSLDESGLVIDERTAELWGVEVGDEVNFSASFQETEENVQTQVDAVVENTILLTNPDSWEQAENNEWHVFMGLDTLQKWTDTEGQTEQLLVSGAEGISFEQLGNHLRDFFPAEANMIVQPAVVDESQVATGFEELYASLYVVGGLSLLISAFILYNTLYISVVERRKEFALMKAVGYTPGQTRGYILREVFILSLVGTVIGLGIGVLLSYGFMELLAEIFSNVLYELKIGMPLLIAAVAGLVIPLIAAWLPVMKASNTEVTDVFRESISKPKKKPAFFLIIVGALLLIPGLFWEDMLAFLPLFLGIAILFPFLFSGIIWLLLPVSKLLFQRAGKFAARNLNRQKMRTALTAAIMSFGVTLLVFLSSIGLSVSDSMSELIEGTLGGDVSVVYEDAISEETLQSWRDVEGVDDIETLSTSSFLWYADKEENDMRLMDVNSVTTERMENTPLFQYNQDYEQLLRDLEEPNTIALGREAFDQWGGEVGDTLTVETVNGAEDWTVEGVVDTYRSGGYIGFIHDEQMEAQLGVSDQNEALLLAEEGTASSIKTAITSEEDASLAAVRTAEEQIDAFQQQTEDIFFVLNVLVIFGMGVAGIGIANTLLMGTIERVPEFGTMRAIGSTKWQIQKVILSEAFFIGTGAAIIGSVVGIGVMFLTSVQEVDYMLDLPFHISWLSILLAFIFSITVSMVACILPARRAAKVNISRALRYE
ncbi:ABC transporter permease [Oceanobacillus jeddahense]|uniref:ABC transporter permease n=1 Tax=Oceanobacillus jeddahense TaxID=1462527 RepID=A0ABY5JPV8_9BACI|nr:FtsX-like permease family protein [Oceanobacillus jeddahense]UUI01121.1 ABC transporter permease [Oceanobacillus jeddahense]